MDAEHVEQRPGGIKTIMSGTVRTDCKKNYFSQHSIDRASFSKPALIFTN